MRILKAQAAKGFTPSQHNNNPTSERGIEISPTTSPYASLGYSFRQKPDRLFKRRRIWASGILLAINSKPQLVEPFPLLF
jgi:hypothetical protein